MEKCNHPFSSRSKARWVLWLTALFVCIGAKPLLAEKPTTPPKPSPKAAMIQSPDILPSLALLPKGSQIILSVSGFSQISQDLSTSALGKLFQEPEWKAFEAWNKKNKSGEKITSLLRMLFGFRGITQGLDVQETWKLLDRLLVQLANKNLAQATDLFHGPHLFSVVRVPVGSERLQFAAILRHRDQEQATKLVEALLAQIPLKRSRYTIGQQTIHAFQGLEHAMHIAYTKDFLLLSTTQGLMGQMLARSNGQGEGMERDPLYLSFLKATRYQRGLSLYIATASFLKQLAQSLEPMIRSLLGPVPMSPADFLEGIGFFGWRAAGLSLQVEAGEFVSRFHLSIDPKNARGLSRFVTLLPVDPSLLRFTPHQVFSHLQFRFSAVSLWRDVVETIKKADPRLSAVFLQNVARLERGMLDGTLEETIRAFGENFAFFFHTPKGTIWPTWAGAIKLHDPKRVQKLLRATASFFTYEFKDSMYEGQAYARLLPIRFDSDKKKAEEKSDAVSPRRKYPKLRRYHGRRHRYRRHRHALAPRYAPGIPAYSRSRSQSPSYRDRVESMNPMLRLLRIAYVGEYLLIAPSPQVMRDLIDAFKAKPRKRLVALRERLAKEAQQSGFSAHLDLRPHFGFLYQTLLQIWPLVQSTGVGGMLRLSSHRFPRAATFLRHLNPIRAALHWDGENSITSLHSSFGLEWLLVGNLLSQHPRITALQQELARSLADLDALQRLTKKNKQHEAAGRFDAALSSWKALQSNAYLSSALLIARKEIARLTALHEQQQRALRAALQKQAPSIPGDWEFQGDWSKEGDALVALTTKRRASGVLFGDEQLRNYTLSFEVHKKKGDFSINVHEGSTSSGRNLFFGEEALDAGQWTLIRLKVRGRRISYRLGLQHHVVQAPAEQGRIRLTAHAKSELRFRRFAIQLEEQPTEKIALPKRPILRASLRSERQVIAVGSEATYLLTLHNQGGASASDLRIQIGHDDIAAFVALDGTSLTFQKDRRTGLFSLSPLPLLRPQQKIQIRIKLKALKTGSSLLRAFLSLPQSPADIALEARSHFVAP